jgi:peptide/nickel transport system substrate-binding protein
MRKHYSNYPVLAALILAAMAFTSCGGGAKKDDTVKVKSARAGINEVIIHINSSPDKLNPITLTNAYAQQISNDIFMSALGLDPDSIGVIIPAMAKSRPTVTEVTEGEFKGGLKIDYELKPEAVWDNGTPVTGDDVAFTIKVYKNPKVDCEQGRPYFDFIKDVVVDPSNKKKYSVFTKDKYFLSELQSGITVIPAYHYDPNGLMAKFTIKELNDPVRVKALKSNPDIVKFADAFNGEYFARDPKGIVGCGPYEVEKWEANQRVVLKRKAKWWGDVYAGKEKGFEAYPDKLIYEIIPDYNASLSALKGEKLDVHSALAGKDYVELSSDGKLNQKYNFYKPRDLSYNYMPMNMNNPKLKDIKVRRALAYLLDVDQIIDKITMGLAVKQAGPVNALKDICNPNIKPVPYDPKKAEALLSEAGWEDSDGDGVRDKVLNGVRTKLEINMSIPAGSPQYEKMALLFQESCKKAGVAINIQPKEFTVLSEELQHHTFEMSSLGWGGVDYEDDPIQVWHTKSYNGGSNYCGFGDAKSDALIDKLRYEQDKEKRKQMQMELQQMIVDAQPYIFMYSRLNRMCIHKRFDNAGPKIARPGFVVSDFKLNKEFGL